MLLSSIHHVISQHQQQISSLAEHQTVTLRTLPTAQSCVTKGPEPLNQLIDSDPLEPTSCNSLWIPSLSNQAQKTGRGASLSVILTNTQISKLQTTSKHQLWNETPTCFTLGWILGYSLWHLPYPKHRNASFWMGHINASHDAISSISSPRSFLHGDWAQHCRTANRQWPSALGSSWMVTPRGKKATQWEQEWLDNTSENDAISSSSFMSTSFHYLDLESFIWTNILCINILIIVCLEHFEMHNTCEWIIKSTDNIISIVTIAMIHIYNYYIYIYIFFSFCNLCFRIKIFVASLIHTFHISVHLSISKRECIMPRSKARCALPAPMQETAHQNTAIWGSGCNKRNTCDPTQLLRYHK